MRRFYCNDHSSAVHVLFLSDDSVSGNTVIRDRRINALGPANASGDSSNGENGTRFPKMRENESAASREVDRMRKWAIPLLLAGVAWPALAGDSAVMRRVTVEQLEQALATAPEKQDRRLAKQISDMKLTERLSAARLIRLQRELRGPKAREALIALSDESAFLDLPAREIPDEAAPSRAQQTAMLGLAVDYVENTIAGWPSFIAERETTRFEGTATVIPADLQDELFSFGASRAPSAANWECPGEPKTGHRRLSLIDRSSVAVVNRNGRELHTLGERGGEFECPENAVSTTEEFGRVLAWVPKIIAHGRVDWGHWERGPAGLLAVFRYSVLVSHRSLPVDIHGEIALNPGDGSILRLTQIRHWTKHEPASGNRAEYDATMEYDTAVDYGPVHIGGVVCICPLKRVAMYLAPILWPLGSDSEEDQVYRRFGLSESPLQEYLNDVSFTQYRPYGAS